MTESDKLYLIEELGTVMDSAETKPERFSINIHAPCSNLFVSGDHVEVNIHLANRCAAEDATRAGEPIASEVSHGVHLEPERAI